MINCTGPLDLLTLSGIYGQLHQDLPADLAATLQMKLFFLDLQINSDPQL